MEQAIYKVLDTIRYKHLIYTSRYGFEPMIGEDEIYVRGDLPRRIKKHFYKMNVSHPFLIFL